MRTVPVPCLKDNYAYLVICEVTGAAAVVDPSEAEPVLAALAAQGATLRAIWNTHHHWDHTGGNQALAARLPGLEIVGHGSDSGRIPGMTRGVGQDDQVCVGQEGRARILHNPGHTSGAISYYLAGHAAVFTGDTLFGAGCGRLFEGTPGQMHASLRMLAALPDDTRVYCGHEYTASNLGFAAAVEPANPAIRERARAVAERRQRGEPSVPSTMAEERATNPFLRVHEPAVAAAARAADSALGPAASGQDEEIFAAVRRWKDRF